MKIRFFLIVALVSTLASWAIAQDQSTRNAPAKQRQKLLVLRGGLLIDGRGGTPLKDPVVTISGSKIQAIGAEGSVAIPADATVINTSGKTILPGLVDSHVHLRDFLAPLFLYWGITSVGDMGNNRGWILAYKEAVEKGRTAGPYIMAAGSRFNAPFKPGDSIAPGDSGGFQTFLSGNSARNYVTDEASLDRILSETKKLRVDGIKLFSRMDPALMKLTAREAHRYGFPVFAHFTSDSARLGLFLGTDEVLDTGIDVYVHLYGLTKATAPPEICERIASGENLEGFPFLDTSKFPPLAQKMVQNKIVLNPTLVLHFAGGSKRWREFDRLNTAFLEGPIGGILPEPVRARYIPFYKAHHGESVAEQEEGLAKAGPFIKQFVDRGGKVTAGSDAGNQRIPPSQIIFAMIPGLTLHMEMQMLQDVGLTPMQVIQSATSWSKEAWGKSKEAGTVEAGKRADILILNRNPLDDMTATTDIYKVIQGGTVIDRDALARWNETMPPRPDTQEGYANGRIHVPLIDEISPELLPIERKNGSELTITGENFSNESLVLINDRLLTPKFHGRNQLRISLAPGFLKKAGVYPVVIVRPGPAGSVSNTFYLMVSPD